ncbi:ribose 5-phosphate isomerase B [Anoxybacter fermentans]|uniref:Ribose 5-phosphate isomerase B n=1 Tax=Anoxybacter fermentans TaxID=1323375 RepID=A0A3S9T2P1_9FIRM|nr:ribose 5-phosphate isomerase B [Anoxybacter fermentans]
MVIASDHGGYALKETLKAYLKDELGYEVRDFGCHSEESVDYPDFAYLVARAVADGQFTYGIIVDGVGIGSCMVANKVKGIRAAMCYDHFTAVNSKSHNDANVLTLGGRVIGEALAKEIVKTWLETPFSGGRHSRRVNKIMQIELDEA